MVSIDTFYTLALSFPDASELSHFEKRSFRVNKKIFITLDIINKRAVVKLSPIDQSVFCEFDKDAIYPVKGAWGKQGWTAVELKKVNKSMMVDLLTLSYDLVKTKRTKPRKSKI
ncbi:MAG: MmcQ/YjbR family DNA-binding protein [Cyclobacteriaceae bacterium]|nr:MmcQ/YjbR family DNA-binding protein [Cyclobacteriaceae bacterium]